MNVDFPHVRGACNEQVRHLGYVQHEQPEIFPDTGTEFQRRRVLRNVFLCLLNSKMLGMAEVTPSR